MAGAVTITPADLEPFAEIDTVKANAMIADALARAAVIAPCILSDDFEHTDAAKGIIRGAILRWHDAGTGAITSKSLTTGPFGQAQSVDTRQVRKGMFWPSEIEELKGLCEGADSGGAFTLDTVASATVHGEICALNFGAAYCSCGADIAGFPLYEPDEP